MTYSKNLYLICIFNLNLFSSYAQVWQQLADFPSTERDDGVSFTLNNFVYCGTGLQQNWSTSSDFYRFDMNTDTWDTIAPLPLSAHRQAACGFSYNGEGYVFGGFSGYPLNDLWKYNPQTDTWIQKASKPGIGLSGASCFELNGKAYIIGGNNGDLTVYNQVWEYTIATDSWSQKNNFPASGSWRASAVAYSNNAYLIFGMDTAGSFNRNLYKYNVQADSWTILSTFPQPGRILSSLSVIQNSLVVFAGVDSVNSYYNNLWYFSFYDSLWYQGVSLPAIARKEGICFNSVSALYYTIGLNPQEIRLKETWKIDNVIGVLEFTNSSFLQLFPNPCASFFTIDSQFDFEFELLSSLGEIVNKIKFKAPSQRVDVSNLPAGFYYLKRVNSKISGAYKLSISK